MKRISISIILVLLTAAIAASVASAGNAPDSRLDVAASSVVGRSVNVWCETSWADWVHLGDALHTDYSYTLGFSFPFATTAPLNSTLYIAPDQCMTLRLLLGNPGGSDVGPAEAALAVHTLVHEATHLALSSGDEHLVDCTALTHDATVATTYFGVPSTEQQVNYQPVKRHGRTIAMRRVVSTVPSTYLQRFTSWDWAWHNNAPAPYNGPC
jgi:hypothetical protein